MYPKSADSVDTVATVSVAGPPWYPAWLQEQIWSQPEGLFAVSTQPPGADPLPRDARLQPLWDKFTDMMFGEAGKEEGPKSIDGMTDRLAELGYLSDQDGYDAGRAARKLVFAVLGWQTMLYKPDVSSSLDACFRIADETDGSRGDARICLEQPMGSGRECLPDFLLGFGMVLPPKNYCAFEDADEIGLFGQTRSAMVKEVNAYILTEVCGVRIEWVDSLSCHLDFDKHSGKLYLYRYPGFCAASLPKATGTPTTTTCGGRGRQRTSPVHRCALALPEARPWACEEGVTGLLREVLLSYRLLFGQDRRSRRVFRRQRPFRDVPAGAHDSQLGELCGSSRSNTAAAADLVEREEYDLALDLPHLRSKVTRLVDYASRKRSRSLRERWLDKRDSTAWLAFWSVLVFGSVSVFLTGIQTVFSIMSYAAAVRQGSSD